MIRTRDFILFLIAVAFLVLAIGFEVIQGIFTSPFVGDSKIPRFGGGEGISPEAEIVLVADTRGDRLAHLKEVIGAMVAPAASTVIEEEAVVATATESAPKVEEPFLCQKYQVYSGLWPTTKLSITEREGVRIFHQSPIGTTTDGIGTVLIILPMREFPAASASCLPSDVVGIATDGSLIRNNEQTAYGVFDDTTLTGYALDGFPIYGVSTEATDKCGGKMTPSGYRYYLSLSRESVIGCFAAVPIPLP